LNHVNPPPPSKVKGKRGGDALDGSWKTILCSIMRLWILWRSCAMLLYWQLEQMVHITIYNGNDSSQMLLASITSTTAIILTFQVYLSLWQKDRMMWIFYRTEMHFRDLIFVVSILKLDFVIVVFPNSTCMYWTEKNVISSMKQILLQKPIVTQLIKKFLSFYETWRFTRAHYWSPPWDEYSTPTSSHPISLRSILILFSYQCPGIQSLPFRFSD